MSDSATTFATLSLEAVLAAMEWPNGGNLLKGGWRTTAATATLR